MRIHDIATMTQVYRTNWQAIQGTTCRTLARLGRAEALCSRMTTLFGLRQLGADGVAEATDLRNRAFTYLVTRYDEVRRGVAFLRWGRGGADRIAPSLYAIARGKPRKNDVEQQPAQPVVIGPNGPFVPATAAAATTPSNGGSPTLMDPKLPGMPGGSPFVS